jgi:hypothetical protein
MKWWPFKKQTVDVLPGQQSIPAEETMGGTIGRLSGFYDFATPDFPPELLAVLEPLSVFNPDVSQALSIWVNLGNTGHEVAVEARNPEAVLDRLNFLAGNVYHTGGGMDGLVNHFFRQIPLMGALSAEWVIADRVTEGVFDVAVVPVKSIRFKRDEGVWRPYQYTGRAGESAYVKLNPFTYSYGPLQTLDGRPYAIPPWLAAIKNIEGQLDALGNIGHILKKMGLLGFLDVALEVPPQKSGESDEAYASRLQKRLAAYAKAYAANLSKGVAVHYKDQEAKHNAISPGAAAGAKQIWELNEEQILSGLDIPPSMMGRSYSTTETYAEVDYERLVTKLVNARRMIKRFIEKGYTLDLLLRGIDANIAVSFNQNSGFQQKEKEEAEGKKIENVLKKRDGGIISDDEAARELGYDEATGRLPGDIPPAGLFNRAGSRHASPAVRFAFNRQAGRYEFKPEVIRLEEPADDRRDQSYVAALQSVLDGPEEAAIAAALEKAEEFADTRATARAFAQAVFAAFADMLRGKLAASAVGRVTDRFTGDAWQHYRHEDTSFLQATTPRPLSKLGGGAERRGRSFGLDLGVIDRNALRYLTSIERYYFGRGNYLADNETTGRNFVNWLEREYIAKGLNIKDNPTWDEFRREFPEVVRTTSYRKTVQLVSTTMSRVQNMGQTLSLYENGFERYRIVGPRTAPICEFCKSMLDRVFEVKAAATRLAKILEKGFESRSQLPPFLSSHYTLDQVQGMSDEELQAAGFESPPFHPECRHRKVAED